MEGLRGVRKAAWTKEEDELLRKCIDTYGEGKWNLVPGRAGLARCRKSCRLRWLNYLKPNIKRGGFSPDEVDLMIRLHKLLGNRWSLIAGRLPGRTPNDVKNFWNTHMNKRRVSRNKKMNEGNTAADENVEPVEEKADYKPSMEVAEAQANDTTWWKSFLLDDNDVVESNRNDLWVENIAAAAATKVDDTTTLGLLQDPFCDLSSLEPSEFWSIFLRHST